MMNRIVLLLALLSAGFNGLPAQQLQDKPEVAQLPGSLPGNETLPRFAVKTNLLYDATTTFNLGVEFWLSRKTSLDVSGNWNPWTFDSNRKWKHALIQPEFRLWTKETFRGHFFGLHGHYAYYNAGRLPNGPFAQNMKESRYEGWLAGAGLGYGYRWNFSRRWAMEAEIGVGYAYMNYDKYECRNCGAKLGSGTRNYFGPTKAAVSLIYSFGSGKKAAPAVVPAYIPPVTEVRPVPQPVAPQYAVAYITPEPETVQHCSEPGKAFLDFIVGRSEIVPTLKNNAAELGRINRLVERVKNNPNATITGFTITGYASPEGTYQTNLILSEKRAAALKTYIRTSHGLPESLFTVSGKGEDWATLDTLVSQSAMADKSRILEIVRSTGIFDGREKKLMDLSGGRPYREMLATLFPQLRRSEYTLHYTVTSVDIEKRDNTANLNAAAGALSRKDTITAEHCLLKVSERGRNSAWHNNMGVLYGLQEAFDKAAAGFERAAGLGNEQAAQNLTLLTRYREEVEIYEKAK